VCGSYIVDYMLCGTAVGCGELSLPQGSVELEADTAGSAAGGDRMIRRLACMHGADNSSSWLVTCHQGTWTASDPEAVIDCSAHARHTPLHRDLTVQRVTAADNPATNQGQFNQSQLQV